MLSPRRAGRGPLARLVAHVLIAAFVVTLLPAPAQAAFPSVPGVWAALPDLPSSASVPTVLLVAVAIADGSPCTVLIAVATPSDPINCHRARWMDPRVGRFLGMDPWVGSPFDPATLHKYLYANGDAVNRIDPSGHESLGTQLTAISGAVTVFLSNFGARLASAFSTGGPVLGQFFNDIGRYAQGRTLDVLLLFQRFNPQLIIQEGKLAGPRIIDFFVRFGNRASYIETKWGLPWRRGEALTRLVEQVKAAVAAGEGEVVLFTIRFPNMAQLNLLKAELGNLQVTLVHGVEAWGEWLTRFVR